MIVVIDDRIARQQKKIGDRTPPDFVKLKTLPEINVFIQAFINNEHPNLSGVRVLAVHRNIPELYDEKTKTGFVEYCKQKQIPLIWFGGDYSSASSIEEGKVFVCNASIFYERLLSISDIEGKHLPERMLFGEGYKISFLMCMRRLVRQLIQENKLDELRKARRRFIQIGYKDLFDTIGSAGEEKQKLDVLNEAIEEELRSL
ncbi:MAG: hypothetical protein KI786_09500 [Mameliella sp.]|nr:hypothetical protein [Phaeodactylibacter sp.]